MTAPNGASASPSASSSSGLARSNSTILSPNHPINLRKQAQPQLDSTFSVKSYIGAANALLEKAQAADAQGQLEVAFVNYLKAAGVASFISKHDEWPSVQKSRGSAYHAYNELMQQVPTFIDRTKRIEEQLRIREERNTQLQQQAREKEAQSKLSQSDSVDAPAQSPTTAEPPSHPANQAENVQATGRVSHGTDACPIGGEVLASRHGVHSRMSASLADRLQALRGPGADAGHANDQKSNGASSIPRTSDLASHLESLAESGDDESNTPRPPVARDGFSSPTLPNDDSFSMNAVSDALRGLDSRQPDQVPSSDSSPDFPPVPTVSQFAHSYPTLDDFERNSLPATAPSGTPKTEGEDAIFPRPPTHQVGKVKRPLPEPPAPPSSTDFARELAIARNVPEPFAGPDQKDLSASASRRQADGLPEGQKGSLPFSRGLGQSVPQRPQPAPRRPSEASSQLPPAPSLLVGQKPSAPLANHISVEDLFKYLYPGFEEFTDADGNRKIGKRRGLDVLLLDIRSRDEWETARVKGAKSVCVEPITLREGMSSADIEDKLLLSSTEEQASFAKRNEVDLVVLYDRNLRSLKAAPNAPQDPQSSTEAAARARMNIVIKAIYENEFRKTLKHQPVLLVGGFDSWYKTVGEKGIVGTRSSGAEMGKSNGPDGAKRTSISFEPGTRFPTAEEPSSRAALNEQQAQQELKKARRQHQVFQDGNAQRSASPQTPQTNRPAGLPVSLYPGARTSVTSSFGSTSNYAYNNGGSGPDGAFSPPSIPARTYQSPGTPSTLPSGAPSFPPMAATRPGDYSNGVNTSHRASISRSGSASFDYPQLKQSGHSYGMSTPQPPPMAVSTGGSAGSGRSSRNASVSTPTPLTTPPASDPSKRQVAAPGYAGQMPAPSRMYSGMSNGRSAEDIRIGLTGLKNLGNSCYMNSTLQCLSATIPLARFLLDGSYKRAINRVNPLGTQGALAEAFAQLVRVMWSEQYTFVSPVTFREAIARFAPAFRGYDQHDSQEFLAFLLDGLHEDLNYVVHKPPPVEMTPDRENELETLPQQIASVKEWGIYRMRNDSLIVDWFQGQFRNKLTCLTCGKTSTTYNAFMYLSLPIPHGRGVHKATLQQCLDAFVREEVLDKADAWNCPQCKKPRKATKRLSISRLPQVLLIHLKRFSFKGPFTDKIDTTVTFPSTGLDLTNYMPPPLPPGAIAKGMPVSQSQQPPYLYDLYGVTHHFGSLNTGHYTATIRNHGEWYYCDDSRVQKCDDRQIKTNSPYVLWFRRRPNN